MFESIMYKISPILHKAFFVMAIVALFDAIFLFVSGEILAGISQRSYTANLKKISEKGCLL